MTLYFLLSREGVSRRSVSRWIGRVLCSRRGLSGAAGVLGWERVDILEARVQGVTGEKEVKGRERRRDFEGGEVRRMEGWLKSLRRLE